MCRSATGAVASTARRSFKDREVVEELLRRSETQPGLIAVETCGQLDTDRWTPEPPPEVALYAGEFRRNLDLAWRRNSYSGIVATDRTLSQDPVGSEPDDDMRADEPA